MLARISERAAPTAELALALGRRCLVQDHPAEALQWLVRARSLATAGSPLVVARIAFLLGAIHLGRDESVATDAVLAWAEGVLGRKAEASADVAHLRALLAEQRGEREAALALYRRVLQRASVALTPMTQVLAMRNLAAALAHSRPRESAGLYGMSLAVLEADELDAATRCAIDNGMGYALLCTGDVEGARLKLDQARTEARRVGSERVEIFARFNLAIVDELCGDLSGAAARLLDVARDAEAQQLDELLGWTRIRRAWLHLRSRDRAAAAAALRESFAGAPRSEHRDAIATLKALLALTERPAPSRAELAALAAAYGERDDALTEFTLMLWIARADATGGRIAAARRSVARACVLAADRGFRLGTSWWSPELVSVARELAPAEYADVADDLIAAPGAQGGERAAEVALARDGGVAIDGRPIPDAAWRQGRSGSGVLRRYFRALVSAYPAPLGRDELADLLWPESEGDKAVRNLYDATKDLRRVLTAIPGVRLEVVEGTYRLGFAPNVRLR